MTPEQDKALARLRELWPDKADEIARQLTAMGPDKASIMKVKIDINYTLEKFDGEYSPDKVPVEVITGHDNIGERP